MENKNIQNKQQIKKPLFQKPINKPLLKAQKPQQEQNDTNIKTLSKEDIKRSNGLMHYGMKEYVKHGDLKEALFYLEKAVEINPNNPYIYYNFGVVYSNNRDHDKAIEYFQKALMLNQELEGARYNLANEYSKKGLFDNAISEYKKILEINPIAMDAMYNLAFITMKSKNDFDNAIILFKNISNLNPLHFDARFNLALCYYFKGDKEKSVETLFDLIRLVPDHYNAHYNIACIHLELGEKEKALIHFKKYLDLENKKKDEYNFVKIAKRRVKELEEEFN